MFKKGHAKLPGAGRTKGTPDKITQSVKEMILGALSEAGGQQYLLEQSFHNPVAFLSLLGKILPKDVSLTGADGGPLIVQIIRFEDSAST